MNGYPERKMWPCRECHEVGATHCTDPELCGGTCEYIRADLVAEKDAEIETLMNVANDAHIAEAYYKSVNHELVGILAEQDARIAFLDKALEQAIRVTALRYLPPKEAEGSDGRITQLPAGLACSHTHEREGWTDYTNKVISENPELVSELIKRGASDE